MKKLDYICIIISILFIILIAVFDPEHLGSAIFPALIAVAFGYSKFAVKFRTNYEFTQNSFIILLVTNISLLLLLFILGFVYDFNSNIFYLSILIYLIISFISISLFYIKYVKRKV